MQRSATAFLRSKIMARIREKDIVIPALQAAASNGGMITMTELIEKMEAHFQPTGEDADIIQGRSDTKFSQKVRNLVSHRDSGTSMFSMGYAVYHADTESIQLTDAGRNFLNQVPEA